MEYKENHSSASVYLKLALKNPFPDCINVSKDTPVSIVIWTTTPWTLPANQAVCFSPDEHYCLVQSKAHDGQYMLIASQLRTTLEQLWSTQLDVINEFPGIFHLFLYFYLRIKINQRLYYCRFRLN